MKGKKLSVSFYTSICAILMSVIPNIAWAGWKCADNCNDRPAWQIHSCLAHHAAVCSGDSTVFVEDKGTGKQKDKKPNNFPRYVPPPKPVPIIKAPRPIPIISAPFPKVDQGKIRRLEEEEKRRQAQILRGQSLSNQNLNDKLDALNNKTNRAIDNINQGITYQKGRLSSEIDALEQKRRNFEINNPVDTKRLNDSLKNAQSVIQSSTAGIGTGSLGNFKPARRGTVTFGENTKTTLGTGFVKGITGAGSEFINGAKHYYDQAEGGVKYYYNKAEGGAKYYYDITEDGTKYYYEIAEGGAKYYYDITEDGTKYYYEIAEGGAKYYSEKAVKSWKETFHQDPERQNNRGRYIKANPGKVFDCKVTSESEEVYELPPKAISLFSSDYIRIRKRLLERFFFNGQLAQLYTMSEDNKEITFKFGDQGLSFGFALVAFSIESNILSKNSLNPISSNTIISQILQEIKCLDKAERYFWDGLHDRPGFILRDRADKVEIEKYFSNRTRGFGANRIINIESDFNYNPDPKTNPLGPDGNAMSQDQIIHILIGLDFVHRFVRDFRIQSDAENIAKDILNFMMGDNFNLTLPSGKQVPRGPDARPLAGFFCKIGGRYALNSEVVLPPVGTLAVDTNFQLPWAGEERCFTTKLFTEKKEKGDEKGIGDSRFARGAANFYTNFFHTFYHISKGDFDEVTKAINSTKAGDLLAGRAIEIGTVRGVHNIILELISERGLAGDILNYDIKKNHFTLNMFLLAMAYENAVPDNLFYKYASKFNHQLAPLLRAVLGNGNTYSCSLLKEVDKILSDIPLDDGPNSEHAGEWCKSNRWEWAAQFPFGKGCPSSDNHNEFYNGVDYLALSALRKRNTKCR